MPKDEISVDSQQSVDLSQVSEIIKCVPEKVGDLSAEIDGSK